MGAVYLAEDTLLERQVAVKFLHSDLSRNADKLQRFIREAKAASALNHPNIMTVHEIGEADGTKYIVTEFIEGKTLREYFSADESISLSEVLTIAVQVAEALAAAHRAGIIHRDIKPENIMIREDGYAKVLDFGLAKLTEPGVTATGSEDSTRIRINTMPGMVMGTVSYMSPEQARGKQTDARTDLWSLGVLLYEMIARKLPFAGETMSDTIAAILTKEPPPLAQIMADCPAELERMIGKALTKKTDERYQTAAELMSDLKTLRRGTEISGEIEYLKTAQTGADAQLSTGENEPPPTFNEAGKNQTAGNNELPTDGKYLTYSIEVEKVKRRYRKRIIAVVGLLLVGSLAYFGYLYFKPRRLIETAFNRTTFEKISISGSVELTVISPDKRYLAYVERKSGDETRRLVLRQMETGAEKEILPMGKSFVRDIKFSPDGNHFYYAFESLAADVVQVDIFRVPLLGGEPEKVVENIARIFSLSPDGRKVAFIRNERSTVELKLIVRDLETKEERILASAKDRDFQSVAFSPDGAKIAVFATDADVKNLYKLNWILPEGGELRKVSDAALKEGATMDWLNDGSGLVIAGRLPDQKYGQLYKISFPQGSFTPITTSTSTFSGVSVSQDGGFMVAMQTNKSNGVWEFDLASKSARQIIPTTKDELKVEDVTSAGRLLVTRTDNKGKDGLLLINAGGTAGEKFLTLYNGENSGPLQRAAITGDEKYCYYVSDNDLWRINLDGSGKEKLTDTPSIKKMFGGIAPDSSYILFNKTEPWAIQKFDIAARSVTPILEKEGNYFVFFGFARNKNLIAYSAGDEKSSDFLLARFDGQKLGEPKNFVNITRSTGFVFSPDGNKVYFTPYGNGPDEINTMEMAEKDLVSGKLSKITNFNIEEILNYTIARDGKKLYLVRGNTSDEVVLIRNVE
jgi:serine/threonine protein kinase